MCGTVETRTGIGYDIHRFSNSAARPLVLGGVRLEDSLGLEGHSDADALLHSPDLRQTIRLDMFADKMDF